MVQQNDSSAQYICWGFGEERLDTGHVPQTLSTEHSVNPTLHRISMKGRGSGLSYPRLGLRSRSAATKSCIEVSSGSRSPKKPCQ